MWLYYLANSKIAVRLKSKIVSWQIFIRKWLSVLNKGQLISKCLFSVFNASKKTKENNSTWGTYHSSYVEFFRLFFGRIEDTKTTFRNQLTFINQIWDLSPSIRKRLIKKYF